MLVSELELELEANEREAQGPVQVVSVPSSLSHSSNTLSSGKRSLRGSLVKFKSTIPSCSIVMSVATLLRCVDLPSGLCRVALSSSKSKVVVSCVFSTSLESLSVSFRFLSIRYLCVPLVASQAIHAENVENS